MLLIADKFLVPPLRCCCATSCCGDLPACRAFLKSEESDEFVLE
jgi:hypothetical protein